MRGKMIGLPGRVATLSLLLASFLSLSAFGRGRLLGQSVPVTGIEIPLTASVKVGSASSLTPIVLPFNASVPAVNWRSSSPAVATVNASGTVTGVSAGTAQITALATDGSQIISNATVLIVEPKGSVDGECGLAAVNASPTAPTAQLCVAGSATAAAAGSGDYAGLWLWSCNGQRGGASTQCSAYTTRPGSSPLDANGNVGLTSYETLPFQSQINTDCGNCSNGLEPASLYFSANPLSIFSIFNPAGYDLNAYEIAGARGNVVGLEQRGIVPSMGLQRWEDTFDASFVVPVSATEPSSFAFDRNVFNLPKQPEYLAWSQFIQNHPQYWDLANDGGTVTPDERTFYGQEGYIPPMTPLDPADCPIGMSSCTWGDVYAYKMSLIAAITGSYSVQLSDFSDSFPNGGADLHGFNPRVVAFFANDWNHPNLLTMTTSQQSSWIFANAYSAWVDFLSRGFGRWDNTLASRIGTASGRAALVSDQCSGSPLAERDRAEDPRFVTNEMRVNGTATSANYICTWDDQTIQAGRYGPVTRPVLWSLGGAVLTAAFEPIVRYGANLESDDDNYWSAITSFYPGLTNGAPQSLYGVTVTGDQVEVGYKLMKRLWLWNAWAHLADRSGNVRRALAFTSRDYSDLGVLTAQQLGPLQSLIQSIVPTRPFGPAFYYSDRAMRAAETYFGQTQNTYHLCGGGMLGCANENNAIEGFLDSGGNGNYFVSDAALAEITPGSASAPSAWIVPRDWYLSPYTDVSGSTTPDPYTTMPASEIAALTKIAPIVRSPADLASAKNQPLSFTTTGGPVAISAACHAAGFGSPSAITFTTTQLQGFGFYDQYGRLIVVVSNPSPCPDATALSGTINLPGLAAGTYTVTDLFANTSTQVTLGGGSTGIPVTVSRWDTLAFAIVP